MASTRMLVTHRRLLTDYSGGQGCMEEAERNVEESRDECVLCKADGGNIMSSAN
jgi:hypothetical protein